MSLSLSSGCLKSSRGDRHTHGWHGAVWHVLPLSTELRDLRRLAQGERRKSRETFWRRRHLSWVGSKRKILLLWRKEGRKERAQGRNRSEKRSVTEEDTGEEEKGLPHTSHCLTGLDNVRPTAQGSFLPSFHQDVRASSATEPRSWWKDTQSYSLE